MGTTDADGDCLWRVCEGQGEGLCYLGTASCACCRAAKGPKAKLRKDVQLFHKVVSHRGGKRACSAFLK